MARLPFLRQPLPKPEIPELRSDIARLHELNRERDELMLRIERTMLLSAPVLRIVKPAVSAKLSYTVIDDWEDE